MTQDWTADVKKYVPNADDLAIKGIVKHCGIALKSKDATRLSQMTTGTRVVPPTLPHAASKLISQICLSHNIRAAYIVPRTTQAVRAVTPEEKETP